MMIILSNSVQLLPTALFGRLRTKQTLAGDPTMIKSERTLTASPISSPQRTNSSKNQSAYCYSDEDQEDTDSNESISILSPPPLYDRVDSDSEHNTAHRKLRNNSEPTKKKSNDSAYANLMSFLDDASASLPAQKEKNHVNSHEVSPLDIEITQRSDHDRDDLSSMSYSLTSSVRGEGSKAFTSNKYVWNELEYDGADGDKTDSYCNATGGPRDRGMGMEDSSMGTYFHAPPSYLPGDSHSQASSSSTMQSNINDIKSKADAMKQELRQRNQRAKDLQTELTRMREGRKRRESRLREKHSRELEEVKTSNSIAVKKQKEFLAKLQSAVSSLSIKSKDLTDKLEKSTTSLADRVEHTKQEGVRDIRRAHRQWEKDEQALFDKLGEGKRESMQKAANDHIGPKLDLLVKTNQEKVLRRREEAERALLQRKEEFREEMQHTFEGEVQALRDRYSDVGGQSGTDRKLVEVRHRHELEEKALNDRFSQDQRVLAESSDRARQQAAESHLQSLRKLASLEQQAVEEWLKKQQREVNAALVRQKEELDAEEAQAQAEMEQWQQKCSRKVEKEQSRRLEGHISRLEGEAEREIAAVRARLREEAAEEEHRRSREARESLKQLRLEAHDELQAAHAADERSSALVSSLHGEVARLRDRLFEHRKSVADLREEIGDQCRRGRLLGVENAIDGVTSGREQEDCEEVEANVIALREELNQELSKLEDDADRKTAQAEAALAKAQHDQTSQDALHQSTVAARKAELNEEFTRVEDKISQILSQKIKGIADMHSTLQSLQSQNRDLEQKLDEFRSKKVGR